MAIDESVALPVSLRDYFAANVSVKLGWDKKEGITIDGWDMNILEEMFDKKPEGPAWLSLAWYSLVEAKLRYAKADAMLTERAKGKGES